MNYLSLETYDGNTFSAISVCSEAEIALTIYKNLNNCLNKELLSVRETHLLATEFLREKGTIIVIKENDLVDTEIEAIDNYQYTLFEEYYIIRATDDSLDGLGYPVTILGYDYPELSSKKDVISYLSSGKIDASCDRFPYSRDIADKIIKEFSSSKVNNSINIYESVVKDMESDKDTKSSIVRGRR